MAKRSGDHISGSDVPREKQKILIVDDRPENLFVLEKTLSVFDAEVVKATNGNEALAATLDNDFALAILDVIMPGMSGYELAEYLRNDEKTHVLPVIFLTASLPDEQHAFQGYKAGAVDYITKPYAPEILRGKVRVFLEIDRYRREIETIVQERTERIRHLNAVLRSIRNVNQLIVAEKNRDRLLSSVCDNLVRTRGFQGAWIVLTDKLPERVESAHSGFDESAASALAELFARGDLPSCCQSGKDNSDVAVVVNPAADCGECPLATTQLNIATMAIRLVHEDRKYGYLGVAIPQEFAGDDEEESLLREIAGDIAFALYGFEKEDARKRAEEASRASEERYRNTIDSLSEAVHVVDRDLHLLYANKFFKEWSKELGVGIVAGQSLFELFPFLPSSVRKEYESVFETGQPCFTEEQVPVGNREFSTETRKTPLVSEGRVEQVITVVRDITERKNLERQFQEAQKMEAVGQLAGGVAHDFNNLLQVIDGYGTMALDDMEADHPVRLHIEEVISAGKRATRLVGQLLAFSRRQIMRPENLDLNEVVNSLMKMLDRVLGEHIRKDFVPGHRLGMVYGDRGMMEQVLMNLCVNARDAMPGGGDLIIETENVLLNGEYCEEHAWAKPGRFVLLSISDTGCGMDAETADRVFEPFFTTKELGKGTGLGLASVYGIVRQHEGMIQVYSESDKGTTFRVYLPVSQRAATTVGPKVNGAVAGGNETILLAEDDETLRVLGKRILERAGYRVVTACDGMEAVALFRQYGDEVDLLLMDVVMPNLGGLDAYQQIAAICPEMPALFTSGYKENAIHANFELHEDANLIAKPYGREDLLRAIRETIEAKRT